MNEMKFSVKIILLFNCISAFPSVGTSTGIMRQKIMLRRIYQGRRYPKLAKQSKVVSMSDFLASIKNMEENQQKAVRRVNELLELINNYEN